MLSGIEEECGVCQALFASTAWEWEPFVWSGAVGAPASSSSWNTKGFSSTTHIASSHTSGYASRTTAEMGL